MTESDVLTGITIAIMATDGFEEVELTIPKQELESHGAKVEILSEKEKIKSWKNHEWGSTFSVDTMLEKAVLNKYDALILPGGVLNADRLRRNNTAIEMIRNFDVQNKLIAAICHGPLLLIEAGLVEGRKMTSHDAIKTDMINAGADFQDERVVQDKLFITAVGATDVDSFSARIISALAKV
jgi:protease I